MSYPRALWGRFGEWLLAHGYEHRGRPAAKRFVQDLAAGQWRRLPVDRYPLPRYQVLGPRQTTVRVEQWAHRVLKSRKPLYRTFGHLIQDVVAGNWVRSGDGKGSEGAREQA